MMQPSVISGAVAKPISSAPRIAAITTSRPVLRPPSVCSTDAAAQVVQHERLVRFGDAELPRQAGVLDARERRGAGAAGVAGNQDVVGVALGDAGGDRADADFGHELHAHARRRVAVLQVVDQLLEILDRIDVVVRRRADEADAGRRIADAGDVVVDLAAGQLAAFAGLRALRNLDLQLVGVGQVPDRDAEAARGDLLDRRALRVAVGQRLESLGSSPPSPVLLLPPRRFIAMASVSWASAEIEPKLIAPVQNRFTISFAGSTSSIGIGSPFTPA